MKKRQINLDFTSLLDVIMIILFFFIIFSSLETDNLKKDLEDKQQQVSAELEEAKAKNNKADELLGEAQKKNEQADKRLEEANSAVDRSGDNADAIMDFSENKDLKLHLDMNGENGWTLKFAYGLVFLLIIVLLILLLPVHPPFRRIPLPSLVPSC